MSNESIKTIYDLLDEKGYKYDYFTDGYVGPKQGQFFSIKAINEVPGDIRHYLLTGESRTNRIFDPGYPQPSLLQLGFKILDDGTVVKS